MHPTHYGRICPIETPEGPNIGLINSLATYARVNKYGFIESPYRRVVKGKVTDEVVYLSAMEEARYIIAQANAKLAPNGTFTEDLIVCRHAGDVELMPPEKVDLIDVSPKQLVSVAAALIPFLENDDANRALMGSNMQRQAVPLITAEARSGRHRHGGSGGARSARPSAPAAHAWSIRWTRPVSSSARPKRPIRRNRASTSTICASSSARTRTPASISGRSCASAISSGRRDHRRRSVDRSRRACARPVLVAFMPWMGYNFEDSILISERVVRDDVFTSIHIEEFEVMARDTKLGPEEITRDIPNVSEER